MRVTIKDVAEKAGLSTTTVSLVLNDRPHRISEATVKKVRDIAAQMRYRPNQQAVSLTTNKTHTIGLVIPDVGNAFFADLAKGVQTECQLRGFSVLLSCTHNLPEMDLSDLQLVLDHNVDGIILALSRGATLSGRVNACAKMAREAGKPLVLIDRSIGDPAVISIRVDHEMGGYLATKHLLELGHRRVGCITGPLEEDSASQRFAGYKRALQEAGERFDKALVYEGDYRIASGQQGGEYLIQQGVSAIYAGNDTMAFGTYKAAMQSNVSIPDELSVVGFDNSVFSELTVPPLTTLINPMYRLGAEAANSVIAVLQDNHADIHNIVFEPKLIVRESTAEKS